MKHYISYLRVFASFAVVLLHVSGKFVGKFEDYSLPIWDASNIVDGAVRFCVPVFLMITGVLLLNKDEELLFFLRKRYKRVLIPFLFWSVFYVGLRLYDDGFGYNFATIKTVWSYYVTGVSFHFWYIYLILGIYLIIPILRKWTIKNNKKELIFFLAIWVFTLIINSKTKSIFPDIELRYFSGYLGYLVLGFFIANFVDFKNKNLGKYLGLAMFVIGVLITCYLTRVYSIKYHRYFPYFYDGLSLNVAFASAGIFLFFKNLNFKENSIVRAIDSCSYGIYLVHIIVLNFILKFSSFYVPSNFSFHIVYMLYIAVATFFISFTIIYLLKKVKFLQNIVT